MIKLLILPFPIRFIIKTFVIIPLKLKQIGPEIVLKMFLNKNLLLTLIVNYNSNFMHSLSGVGRCMYAYGNSNIPITIVTSTM